MSWIKRTPEAIGIIRQIALDVVTKINFVEQVNTDAKKSMGRPKKERDNVSKAQEFAKQNFLKQTIRAAVMDELALGDGYIWKGKLSNEKTNKILKETLKECGLNEKEISYKVLDEDYNVDRTLEYVPASTMDIEINSEGTAIKTFVQRTGFSFGRQTFPTSKFNSTMGSSVNKTRQWDPEQIIHKQNTKLDGKVHGFTPMQSAFPALKTLGLVKDYHGHFFDSGISPDLIFNFEEMDANSVEHEKMKQVIGEWYNNRRRSFAITTSKMNVERLNEWNKDMEFRLLSIYYTGVIAFAMGFPLEKIRAILGSEVKSTTGGSDIGNTDYQKNVQDMQDDWEDLLNTQFFNETFQVDMKFDRSAARDETAEVQRDAQKLNFYTQMTQQGLIKKENRTDFAEHLFPQIESSWWDPNPEPEMELGNGMMPSSKLPEKGQGAQALSAEKKKQQLPQQKNNPPTGS